MAVKGLPVHQYYAVDISMDQQPILGGFEELYGGGGGGGGCIFGSDYPFMYLVFVNIYYNTLYTGRVHFRFKVRQAIWL